MANIQRIGVLLDRLWREAVRAGDYADLALWHALTHWRSELPALDDRFHKRFRHGDVTGHTDMIIWNLLHHSKRFWTLFEQLREPEKPTTDPHEP